MREIEETKYVDARFSVVGGCGMLHGGIFHGGKKAVEDKPDCCGHLDKRGGIIKGRHGQEWELHNMALWRRRGEVDDTSIERIC